MDKGQAGRLISKECPYISSECNQCCKLTEHKCLADLNHCKLYDNITSLVDETIRITIFNEEYKRYLETNTR